eukprot:Nitzschia sp. Nitz4//scaffold137_size62074//39078//39632//NITZ4_006421-RA/size62074-processed-gene-0.47-mRNA-1//-1//CDS//3329535718//1690//frame0
MPPIDMSAMNSQVNIENLQETLSDKGDIDASNHTCSSSASAVSFALETVPIESTLPIGEYSVDEKYATWYSAEEYREMKKARNKVVSMMNEGHGDDDCSDDCTRGLETKTRKGSAQRDIEIYSCISVVMEEQDRRGSKGCDPTELAEVYRMYTSGSQERAQERAFLDRQAILTECINLIEGIEL